MQEEKRREKEKEKEKEKEPPPLHQLVSKERAFEQKKYIYIYVLIAYVHPYNSFSFFSNFFERENAIEDQSRLIARGRGAVKQGLNIK